MSGFQGQMPPPQGGPQPMAPPPPGGPMAMPQGGMPGGGGQPQLPPQVLQMLLQRLQGGQGGGGPQQPPMQPPGGGQGPMPPPGGAPQQPGAPGGQQRMTPAEMAQKGRFGDAVVAHLTPGEIEVPPQVQTPQLMAMLQQAFARAGVSPQQFTAGSPASSHNPQTGAPEYSLLAALLPILGAVGGSMVAPGIGTAIGGGLGGAAGQAMDRGTPAQIALGGLGGAAGGYLGGMGGGGAASTAALPTSGIDAAAANSPFGTPAGIIGSGGANWAAGPAAAGMPLSAIPQTGGITGGGGMGSSLAGSIRPGLGAGLGAAVGSALAPPPYTDPLAAAGYKTPLPPLNHNFNQLLGNNQSSHFSSAGYNPYAAATGSPYNFYSPTGNGM